MKTPEYGLDGGFIMVAWDKFEEALKWYTEHTGWTCIDTELTGVGKMAFLKHPVRDHFSQVVLKSIESDFEHFKSDGFHEGHSKLTFAVGDIDQTLRYFDDHRIKVTGRRTLPNGKETFDIYGFEGARLTAVHEPSFDNDYPDARFIEFAQPLLIGVTDIQRSVDWYHKHLGYELVEQNESEGYAWMNVLDAYHKNTEDKTIMLSVLLERLPDHADTREANPVARAYHNLPTKETFLSGYNQLNDNGVKTSEIAGDPEQWAGFHCYDPDGNRINVWTYQMP